MQVCWYLYSFDHALYLQIRPHVRAATTPAALAAIVEGPEIDAILEGLEHGDMALPAARSAIVRAVCCVGDALPFDHTLARLATVFDRASDTVDGGDLLGQLLSGHRNLERWLRPSAGLTGFLTPAEAAVLRGVCVQISPRMLRRALGIRRHGGLIGLCDGLLRGLRDAGPPPDDTLRLLTGLLEVVVRDEAGLAAIKA